MIVVSLMILSAVRTSNGVVLKFVDGTTKSVDNVPSDFDLGRLVGLQVNPKGYPVGREIFILEKQSLWKVSCETFLKAVGVIEKVNDFKLRVKLLAEGAKAPTQGSRFAGALDLYNLEKVILEPGLQKGVRTGIAISFAHGWRAVFKEKSGLALKHGVCIRAGLIDSDYRGELVVVAHTLLEPCIIEAGSKICQMKFERCPINYNITVLANGDSLDSTERGTNGFGSTGV